MRNFLNVQDIGDLRQALAEAQEIKADRYKYVELGRNKTALYRYTATVIAREILTIIRNSIFFFLMYKSRL